jgi:hypothetical protein
MKLGDENVEAGVDGNQSVPEIQNQSVTYYNQSSSFDTSNRASLANQSKSFQGEITFGEEATSQAPTDSVKDISLNGLFQSTD